MSLSIPPRPSGASATFTAIARPSTGAGATSATTDSAERQFEAMLLQSAFAPVATALGFYGDLVLAPVMRSILHAEPR
jgi:hypothetical protein